MWVLKLLYENVNAWFWLLHTIQILECFYALLTDLLNIFTLQTSTHINKQTNKQKNINIVSIWKRPVTF